MADLDVAPPGTRRPAWVAGLFTFFLSGLGQLYCGRRLRALALLLADVLVMTAILLAFVHVRSRPLNLWVAAAIWIAWRAGTVADAVLLARRASFPSRWFSRGWAAVLILLLYGTVGWLPIALVVRECAVEALRVPSRSMSVTLLPGDRFLVDKLLPWEPARGDVVVFWAAPDGEPMRFVHRVIGLPGETVEVRWARAVVDGRRLDEPYLVLEDTTQGSDFGPVVVPEGHYFLLGDRRDVARDSRYMGFVARGSMVARAMTIFLSEDPETGAIRWDRVGRVIR